MDYRILGPLEVLEDGTPVDVGSRQQRALLALLLLHANRVVSTERILEALWPADPAGKEKTLWVYVSRLRQILEPDRQAHTKSGVLVTRDHGYTLVADPDAVDATRFEQQAQQASRLLRDDPDAAAHLLADALGLWRGAALEDFAYEEFAQADVARLEEARLVAVEDRVDALIRAGRHREVLAELEQLRRGHPQRERLVSLQMVALYRSGRQADALREFQRYGRSVGEDLGIEPSPELRRLEEQVLLHDARLEPPGGRAVSEELTTAHNPFKGLHSFSERDVATFFGRERLVSDLVRRVAGGSPLLALVGASGSGKSSVLFAGLIPALRKGAIEGSEGWLVAQMVPGARPFREVEAALLRSTLDAPDSLTDLLDDDEDGLLRACLRLVPDQSGKVVLVIDQFEELFTLAASDAERDRFIRNLEIVLQDPHNRVIVVLGLRADFYGMPLEYARFAQQLGDGVVNVAPLMPDELEAAAEGPAAHAGASLEPALVVQLLSDIAGQVGGLPLFQFALTELYERRTGSLLTLSSYHAMGGVRGALARSAEDLFLELDADERAAAQQLFLRLVTIGEQGAWSRRRVAASEIVAIVPDVVPLTGVLDRFGANRLITFDRDLVTGSPTVEVAHEALLHEWPRLRQWISDAEDDVVRHARFTAALAEWAGAGEKPDYLLSGERLADYEAWASVSLLHLSTDEVRFLDASSRQRQVVEVDEETRVARERQLDRKARIRLRGLALTGALIAAALIAGLITVLASTSLPSVAVVHGTPGDLGSADLMISGIGDAEREFDFDLTRVQSLVDPEADLRSVAEAGADLVIVDLGFDRFVERVAPDYPDVHFAAIDPVALHIERPNISELHFSVEDSAFVAGAAAALTTDTKRVGFIGAFQSFRAEGSRAGFEQGVAHADSDVEVVSTYIGPVLNPIVTAEASDDLAYELATTMYEGGVDVIFHDAGEAGAGVLRAARELSDGDRHLWTIGSNDDEYHTSSVGERRHVLSSTVKRFDSAVFAAIEGYLSGTLEPGDIVLGLADDGVRLARTGDNLAQIDGRLANLEGDLAFGHIGVSGFPERSPGWQLAPDVRIALRLTNVGCEVESTDGAVFDGERVRVERGSVIEFALDNRSDEVGGLALRTIQPSVSLEQLQTESLTGIPRAFEEILGITLAEIGAGTGAAAKIEGAPIAVNCILYESQRTPADFVPLIVSPSS